MAKTLGRVVKGLSDPAYQSPETGADINSRLPAASSLTDETNPASLHHLLPNKLAAVLRSMPDDLLELTEGDLRTRVKPDDMLCRLRISFWDEWQRAQARGEKMHMLNIVRGVCSEDYFYKWIVRDQLKMRWVMQIPKDYYLSMREMLDRGLDRLREVLEMPFYEEKWVKVGKDEFAKEVIVNKGVMAEVRAVVQLLDTRVKGAVMQRLQVQQQSVNYNVNRDLNEDLGDLSMDQLNLLESKIMQIDTKLKEVSSLPNAKDSEAIEVESVEVSDKESPSGEETTAPARRGD